MRSLLVVHHSPTATLGSLTDAVLAGARHEDISGVEVVVRPALEASAEDVLGADGYLLVTPANFGYMSGALKHFFDSLFLHVGGSLADDGAAGGGAAGGTGGRRPFGLAVHGRYDTTGAVRSVLAITGALCFYFSEQLFAVLVHPLKEAFGNGNGRLVYTKLYEAFFVQVKIAFFGGAVMGLAVGCLERWHVGAEATTGQGRCEHLDHEADAVALVAAG